MYHSGGEGLQILFSLMRDATVDRSLSSGLMMFLYSLTFDFLDT